MKKLFVICMLAMAGMGAFAQTDRGRSSLGFNVGYGFNDNGNALIGLDYRYNLTDEVRLAPSLTYFVKDNNWSAWAIDMNVHYVFKLSDMFGFYPLAGLDLSFWKWSTAVVGWDHVAAKGSINETRFGANLGLGGEVYATSQVTIGLEFKYNIIKDFDQPILGVRVGYNF